MNVLSASILAVLCVWVTTASRPSALIAMAIGTLYLTQGQSLNVAGFNLLPNRILVYICFFRVLARGEFSMRTLSKMDRALIILYLYTTVVLVLRPNESESIPLCLAKMMDVLFGYFAFRGLVTNLAELKEFLRAFALLLIPFVAMLAFESATKHNLFALVGGNSRTWLRGSSVRCFGSFRHPSLLGALGATFFPLYVGLALDKNQRKRAVLGAVLCTAVVFYSNSGGPLSGWATAVIGWLMWPLRTRMRTFRWGALALLGALALVMKAPVWYLIARLSGITGGDGWHRAYLIDVAVRHIGQWWWVGMPVSGTNGWFPYNLAATGGADITNQYISFGLNAGVMAILLFFVFLTRTFRLIGQTMAFVRSQQQSLRDQELFIWSLGVMLTVHLSTWLGITYWDQFLVLWTLQMAAIGGVCQAILATQNQNESSSIELLQNNDANPAVTSV